LFYLKNILVYVLVIAYPLALQSDYALGKRNSARSSKKKGSNSKKRNSSGSSLNLEKEKEKKEEASEEPVVVQSQESKQVETAPATVEPEKDVGTQNISEETSTSQTTGSIADMSKDPKWEDFRNCMRASCAGGDNQPANVECYRVVNFDNAFLNCKGMIESSKQENFKTYFSGPFLTAEKKAFCEGDEVKGKFNETTGKCALDVKYTRKAYNGEVHKCSEENRSITWYLDGKNYLCSGETLGIEECYQDSENLSAAKTQMWMGIATAALGAFSAVGAGLSAGGQKLTENKKTVNADGTTSVETVVRKDDKGNDVTAGWGAGLAAFGANSGTLSQGATSIATSVAMQKEKGARLLGRCVLPNGETVSEGNSVKLSW